MAARAPGGTAKLAEPGPIVGARLSGNRRETTTLVISRAIVGPAVQWSRGDQTITKDVLVQHVGAGVLAGLSAVVTVA